MVNEYCAQGLSLHLGKRQIIDNVSVALRGGEMTALIGPNGAGKSTLLRLLTGYLTPDSGTRHLAGKPLEAWSPEALSRRRAVMLQRTALQADWTVETVIAMGRSPWGATADPAVLAAVMAVTGCDGLAGRRYPGLSGGEQQRVQLARCLAQLWRDGAPQGWLFLDEPTSALTEGEVAHLFTIIRDLRAQGKAIIYISHKMDEIFAITDEISVFRDGTWVGSKNTTEFTRQSLITQMVGRELTQLFPKFNNTIGEEVLTVRNLTRQGVFHDVSFSVRRGEILGVAGLVGAGRSEVMESLFGMERFDSGEVLIDGAPVTIDSPSVAIEKGMALLTEDRKKSGLFLVLSVLENMSIVKMPEYIGKSGFVQHVKMAEDCMEQIRRLNIKTPTMDQIINNLSGGNQQKVLIARWLLAQPKILILDEPTRGIDVGAKAEIYHLISELANRGVAVIMVSSELPEILGMSDRVMVMHEGRITGILEKDEADQETILSLASH